MSKTLIIILIVIALLALFWYYQSSAPAAEPSKTVGSVGAQLPQSTEHMTGTMGGHGSHGGHSGHGDSTAERAATVNTADRNRSRGNGNGNCGDSGSSYTDKLVIGDSVVAFDDMSQDSEDIIKKKFVTRDSARGGKYKHDNYSMGKRGGNYGQAVDYIDESNDLLQAGYMENDQFVGKDDANGQYAPYKPEKRHVDKFKTSEMFNSNNFLPDKKSENPDWWDMVPDAISVKDRHLINVSKAVGIDTIGTSLRNPSYDIRGSPPCPKFVISPWLQSTIEPDTNLKSLCA